VIAVVPAADVVLGIGGARGAQHGGDRVLERARVVARGGSMATAATTCIT
jgi:hypothetical protein